ncbi:MAG TPA: bifunctional nuclease family protein [Streptosporangiaceae bacterium]
MPAMTDGDLVEMRITKVAGFGPPLAAEARQFVVLEEAPGGRQLVVEIGEAEAFSLAARLQGVAFRRPMTSDFAAALVRALGGHVPRVRLDRLEDGAYAATAEVDGPLGTQEVDARASDALNLAARTGAAVFVSLAVLDDFRERQDGEAAGAGLLRLAPTVPPMTIGRPRS